MIDAFDAFDYPKSKLDIKLVVERQDRETLSRLVALGLPARYEVTSPLPARLDQAPRAQPRAGGGAQRIAGRL